MVEIGDSGVWKKKLKMIQQAVKSSCIADGSDELQNEHVDNSFGSLAHSMIGGTGAGVSSLGPMTGPLALPAPTASSPGPSLGSASTLLLTPPKEEVAGAAEQPASVPISKIIGYRSSH